jgi:phenylalanyl-tRNA synthetase beta chain
MKVLLSWLRDFAPIDGDPVVLGEHLSDLGMAVEELEVLGEGLDGVVVAEVLATRPHPNADKIQLVDVDAGDGEALQIACGAFNMAPGDLVPLATVGTTMPNGMEIGRRKMRGEWSNGMLCSPRELGLGGDHAGIHILPPGLPVGAPFVEAMGIESDVLYDLEINPNRPDAMSVAGVARDLAARLGVPFSLPEPVVDEVPASRLGAVTIEVDAPDLCGRFTARVLRGVTVGDPDPAVARRLTLLGMRPINSLVDVSNYVMLELGQPNHPYDLAKIRGGGLRVRRARDGETLVTLDGVERTFTTDDLLICDAEDRPVGIAGVMGGSDTEIDETTADVLLEMAWFLPISIAKTSRRLRLRSEASARFEKGTDPEIIDLAHRRFAELVSPSGAGLEAGTVDMRGELPDRSPVHVRTAQVNRLLGTELSAARIAELLDPIGFAATVTGDDTEVTIPSWRYDSSAEIDVVEEVARLYGYGALGQSLPPSAHAGRLTARQLERRRLRSLLVGRGLSEAMPLPFLAPGDLERSGLPGDGLEIANPLVAEESVLRTSLLPGLVKALATNAARRNTGVGLWEIGHVFRRPAGDAASADGRAEAGREAGSEAGSEADGPAEAPGAGPGPLPDEREMLGVALGGRDAAEAVHEWRAVAELLGLQGVTVRNEVVPGLHPTRSAGLVGPAGQAVGAVGEVDPEVLASHGIGERVGWLEVDLDVAAGLPRDPHVYRPVSIYPSSDIDLAFEVEDAVPAGEVEQALRDAGGERLASLELFDVYRGTGIAPGRRSLAYTLRLDAPDHTLTDDEVAEVRRRCIDAVEQRFAASLRG